MLSQSNQDINLGMWCSECEAKNASFYEQDIFYVFKEVLSGELAKEVYEWHPHVHRALVHKNALSATEQAFGIATIKEMLINFYKTGGLLSDILDLFDAKGIAYAYQIWNPNIKKWCAV